MGNSWYIGTYWGIPVKIHWTFGLLLFYVGYLGYSNGLQAMETIWLGIYILVIFFCVVLHEYGHALTARRYGIQTEDIILSPIGGIARMKRIPDNGWEEFKVAIAGPLVNVVIATILGTIFYFAYGFSQFLNDEDVSYIATLPGFMSYVIASNVALFIFNLIPAFPMDGGRILRALLSLKLGTLKATKIASIVGRLLALGFVILAFKYQLVTIGFIGVFIFLMATLESRSVIIESALNEAKSIELMRRNYTLLSSNDDMKRAIDIHQSTEEKNFLVADEHHEVVASLPSLFIKDAIKNHHEAVSVERFQYDNILVASPDVNLLAIYNNLNETGAPIAAITDGREVVGVIDRDMLTEFIKSKTKSRLF